MFSSINNHGAAEAEGRREGAYEIPIKGTELLHFLTTTHFRSGGKFTLKDVEDIPADDVRNFLQSEGAEKKYCERARKGYWNQVHLDYLVRRGFISKYEEFYILTASGRLETRKVA